MSTVSGHLGSISVQQLVTKPYVGTFLKLRTHNKIVGYLSRPFKRLK